MINEDDGDGFRGDELTLATTPCSHACQDFFIYRVCCDFIRLPRQSNSELVIQTYKLVNYLLALICLNVRGTFSTPN